MKRIAGIFLAALLALTVLPHGAELVTSDDVTKGIVTTAYAEEHKNHCICGNNTVADSKHTHDKTKTWEAWYSKNSLPVEGAYYLTGNVTMAKAWEPTGDVELCLNGNTIEFTEAPEDINADTNYAAIILKGAKDNQVLTITSCMSGGIIRAANQNLNHGVYMNMPKEKKDCAAAFNYYGNSVTSIFGFRDDGIYVGTGSNLVANIWGGRIAGNSRGVSVRNGVCNMYGGTISSNTVISTIYSSSNGGGVYIDRGATFNMYGGTIEKNSAVCKDTSYGLGGGVAIEGNSVSRSDATTHGTFNMYGGTISGNTAGKNGGGVYVGEGTTFNMTGGTISDNTAKANSIGNGGQGGGVYVDSGATFNMTGGTIGGTDAAGANKASSGGGVYVAQNAKFNMTNGTISGNTAVGGGGVYVERSGDNIDPAVFAMTGGQITNNTVTGNGDNGGGGVYLQSSPSYTSTLKISGNPIINNNTRNSSSDNVGLGNNNAKIEVTAALTEGAEIVLNSLNGATITGNSAYYTRSDKNDGSVTLTAGTGSSGGETGGETAEHKHPVCGGSNCTDSTHADETFQKWESTTSLPASGKYYLANNVTLARSHVVEGDLVLCLNGKTVTASDSITVTNGKTFTLTDCEPNGNKGVISRSSDTTSGEAGVRMVNGAHFVMYGGTIQNSWIGVEVIYESDGTFTMYGGTITGCKSSGVVVQETSNISILGGKITGNYTGMTVYGGKLTIGGDASITGNTGEGNSARNVNFECREITPITVRNDFTGSFGVTVWDSVATGTKIIDGNGYTGTITCDNRGKVIDESGKLRQAPVENTYTVTFVVDSTTPWGTVAPSIVQNVPYGAEIKWNQANRGITVGEQSVAVTPQAEDAEYTYSVEAMRFERNVVTQNTTVTVVFGRTAKTGGETPTPTPEAPRYYYSSGSGSTGAGGLSAVQNDPNGKSATDYSGGIYGLLFRTNAALSAFRGVQVDGVTIDAANYSVEGNEVYLKAVYLQTLANGKHTLTVLSGEGDATAQFTVGGVVSAPKTADAGALAYLGLALSSYVGTALVTRRKKEF